MCDITSAYENRIWISNCFICLNATIMIFLRKINSLRSTHKYAVLRISDLLFNIVEDWKHRGEQNGNPSFFPF